jgi:hypothetical protein
MTTTPYREYKEYTGEVRDSLSDSFFSVTIGYYSIPNNDYSIESYELEGDNISRDELIERFGLDQVNRLEEELN